jgi:hypothetical protein
MSEPDARAAAHRKFGNMTQKSEEGALHLDRALDGATWRRICAMRFAACGAMPDLRRLRFSSPASASAPVPRSSAWSMRCCCARSRFAIRTAGMDSNGNEFTSTQTEHYSDLRELNRSFSDLAGWPVLPRGRQATDRNRRARASHQRSRDGELLRTAGCATGHRKIVHRRGVPGERIRSAGHAPELQLLARRFASDPNVVGRKLTLNNQPVTVVGVLPASFDFGSVFAPGTPVDIFIPWPLNDKAKPHGKHDEGSSED